MNKVIYSEDLLKVYICMTFFIAHWPISYMQTLSYINLQFVQITINEDCSSAKQ